MGSIIKWLIGWPWCAHHWAVIEERNLTNSGGSRGDRYILRCDKCGDVKKRDLI